MSMETIYIIHAPILPIWDIFERDQELGVV